MAQMVGASEDAGKSGFVDSNARVRREMYLGVGKNADRHTYVKEIEISHYRKSDASRRRLNAILGAIHRNRYISLSIYCAFLLFFARLVASRVGVDQQSVRRFRACAISWGRLGTF